MDDHVSDMPTHEREDVGYAWGRVTSWLRRNAPSAFAGLGGPGSPTAISDAEARIGLKLPREMSQWLLANDIGGGQPPGGGSCLVALGCEGIIPNGGLLLGLTDIQRVYLHMWGSEKTQPSADPVSASWRREWIPIAAESDGFYGRFLDTRTGTVGSWSEGQNPEEGRFASLAAFFHDAADHLEGVSSEHPRETATAPVRDGGQEGETIRIWARANGYLVNDQGRVPAAIREAYEASL